MNGDNYQELGYRYLPLQFATEDIETLKEALSQWHSESHFSSSYGLIQNNIYQELPIFKHMLNKYNLGQLACACLDVPEVVLFQDNLIWKPAQTTKPVQWHQDFSYWPLSAPKGITFWIALDDVYEENGALAYIPRSHQWGECRAMNFASEGEVGGQEMLPHLPWKKHEAERKIMNMEAGQAIAHHPLLAHMSFPNLTTSPRRAWSLMWITPDVCWDINHAPHPYPIFHSVENGARLEGEDFPRFLR